MCSSLLMGGIFYIVWCSFRRLGRDEVVFFFFFFSSSDLGDSIIAYKSIAYYVFWLGYFVCLKQVFGT